MVHLFHVCTRTSQALVSYPLWLQGTLETARGVTRHSIPKNETQQLQMTASSNPWTQKAYATASPALSFTWVFEFTRHLSDEGKKEFMCSNWVKINSWDSNLHPSHWRTGFSKRMQQSTTLTSVAQERSCRVEHERYMCDTLACFSEGLWTVKYLTPLPWSAALPSWPWSAEPGLAPPHVWWLTKHEDRLDLHVVTFGKNNFKSNRNKKLHWRLCPINPWQRWNCTMITRPVASWSWWVQHRPRVWDGVLVSQTSNGLFFWPPLKNVEFSTARHIAIEEKQQLSGNDNQTRQSCFSKV